MRGDTNRLDAPTSPHAPQTELGEEIAAVVSLRPHSRTSTACCCPQITGLVGGPVWNTLSTRSDLRVSGTFQTEPLVAAVHETATV